MLSSYMVCLLFLIYYASADYVYLDWNVTWVRAAPDGFSRPMIGINNKWPCPGVTANLGDIIVVDVYNGLGNQSTGIHWHGFHQYMTGSMDGTPDTTQCPIPPGHAMRYEFLANQIGTYWYHSHQTGQYPDGLRGQFIVKDPSPPYEYDEEFTLTLTDHYHDEMSYLIANYTSHENYEQNDGNEPLPNVALINESTNTKIPVEPNKTYLVHIICMGNWPGHAIIFDNHDMTIVETDGIWTDPYTVDKIIRLGTGQRMSVLIRTKDNVSQNFAIWDTMDVNMMFVYENRTIPEGFNPNATAWLVYNESASLPPAPDIHELDPNTDFVDDVILVPADHEPILEPVDRQLILETSSAEINGTIHFTVNGSTYVAPEVPTLYTLQSSTPENASEVLTYGTVNPIIVKKDEIVELVINNHHNNLHPWHLHGHQFQVIQRSAVDGGYFQGYFQNVSSTPVRRDTIMVQNHGHTVLRFRADNPDKSSLLARALHKNQGMLTCACALLRVWLLHCHIEWHVVTGLTATLIEAPEEAREIPVPEDHQLICPAYGARGPFEQTRG